MWKEWLKEKQKERKLKSDINSCFKKAGLYEEYKNQGGKVTYIFPKIESINDKDERFTTVRFSLRNGMNPRELLKHEYIFQQAFGNVEIEGEIKYYSLKIYHKVEQNTFPYNYEEFLPYMKKCKLPIIAGKDKLSNIYVFDMISSPMLLIAGETGGGKSSSIRGILTALIQHKDNITNGLELHLVDFKRTEFHLFRHIEDTYVMNTEDHLLKCLKHLTHDKHGEITKRGDLLDTHELTHIDDYNKMKDVTKKPYIILCIDEVHMLEGNEKIFNDIHKISAMGRALGIYLIMATQRPDKDVIEGKTKSNLTMRYAFAHADKINSDITLGRGVKADASKITKEGQFIYRDKKALKKYEVLQSPYLPPDDEKNIKGAKSILEPFKIPIIREDDNNDNVINGGGNEVEPEEEQPKLTKSDIFGRLE